MAQYYDTEWVFSVLVRSLRDMRDAMTSKSKRGQAWKWEEIEAYLGGAMSVRGLSIDEILEILRGKGVV